jgi:hypothetical protein
MKINTQDPNVLAAINARLVKEIGETFAANCALDLIGDSLLAENASLKQQIAALVEKTTKDRQLIEELRQQIGDLRILAESKPSARRAPASAQRPSRAAA